jgi:ubiquinol-cytochrome c reductase iron-sulfur subunit
MAEQAVDEGRRRFLTMTTAVVGAGGAAAAAVPFLASLQPSERAQAAGAPVTVDVSRLEAGAILREQWRGRPVWIVRRTPEQLAALEGLNDQLRDPDSSVTEQQPEYARNLYRSIKPEYLVLVGICTHLGCSPLFEPEIRPQPFAADWKGGFFCPCHGSKFDMAGRVYAGVPAPTNLAVPPYRFDDEYRITIGLDPDRGAA